MICNFKTLVRNSWKFEILFSWKHLLNSSQKLYWNEIQKNCYCVILWTILEQLLTHYTLLFVLIICHSRHVFCLLPTFYLEDSIYTYNSMPKVVKLHKADTTWSRLSKNNNQYKNHYGWFSKHLENLISESTFGVISRVFLLCQIWIVNYYVKNPVKNSQ